jgi:hypothetical protein
LRNAQNFVLSHLVNLASLLLQAIASDIGLGHGLPSLHTLFTCPRRLLQVTAGVFVGGCANQMHIEQVFTPDRKETHWGKRKLVRSTSTG